MKITAVTRILILMMATVLMFSCRSSRTVHHPGGMPPGQAKKVYGHQSARAFAPGQRKKAVRYAPAGKAPKKGKGHKKGKKG